MEAGGRQVSDATRENAEGLSEKVELTLQFVERFKTEHKNSGRK